MKPQTIKIPQYLVQGKHRTFQLLKFPVLDYACAYWDYDSEHYAIDGNQETFRWLSYGMAALMEAPYKILYFPMRKTTLARYYSTDCDAVLTKRECQFRRSEWNNLRRQLDSTHRIQNYRLRYDPEKLCGQYSRLQTMPGKYYRALKQLDQEVDTQLGNTIFLTMLKETCLAYHAEIVDRVENCVPDLCYGLPVHGLRYDRCLGWYLPDGALPSAPC